MSLFVFPHHVINSKLKCFHLQCRLHDVETGSENQKSAYTSRARNISFLSQGQYLNILKSTQNLNVFVMEVKMFRYCSWLRKLLFLATVSYIFLLGLKTMKRSI